MNTAKASFDDDECGGAANSLDLHYLTEFTPRDIQSRQKSPLDGIDPVTVHYAVHFWELKEMV